MNYNSKLDTVSKLEWAIDTIREQLLFGRDELGAAKARELRAKGVMMDAIEEYKKLEEKIMSLELKLKDTQRSIKYLTHYGNKDCTAMAYENMLNNTLEDDRE